MPSGYSTCLVTAEYQGSGNFVIKALNASGDLGDLLVNTIGKYSGTTSTLFSRGDAATLEVKASGSWTISLNKLSEASTLENGAEMHGDNVLVLPGSTSSKLKITNKGESNFVVYGASSNDVDLLVNEIGNYTGTVPNKQYRFLFVKSEGTWTISW